jgi:hypothetical protein
VTSPNLLQGDAATPASAGSRASHTATRLLIGYVAILAAAELLMTISVPAAACGFALLAVAVCLASPMVSAERGAALVRVLLAIPLVRLLTVAAPGADVVPAVRLAVLAVPTALAVVLAARDLPVGWRVRRCGPSRWRAQAAVALVAVPLSVPVYLLVPPVPAASGSLPTAALVALLTLSVVPDEILFRGLLVPALSGVAARAAVPMAGAVYAATFVGYASAPVLVAACGVGFTLAWLRYRTGSMLGVVGARILLVWLVYGAAPALGI